MVWIWCLVHGAGDAFHGGRFYSSLITDHPVNN